MAGATTDPPALAYAATLSEKNSSSVAYSTVYPGRTGCAYAKLCALMYDYPQLCAFMRCYAVLCRPMQSCAVLFGRIRSHVRIAGGGFFLQAFPSVFLFAQGKPPRESSGEGTFAGRSG